MLIEEKPQIEPRSSLRGDLGPLEQIANAGHSKREGTHRAGLRRGKGRRHEMEDAAVCVRGYAGLEQHTMLNMSHAHRDVREQGLNACG